MLGGVHVSQLHALYLYTIYYLPFNNYIVYFYTFPKLILDWNCLAFKIVFK